MCAFFFACLHRLRGCALQPHHIKVTGFEPMALCTQNRCADQTALHLVSPPEHMVWIYPIEKDSNRSRPPREGGENHRF